MPKKSIGRERKERCDKAVALLTEARDIVQDLATEVRGAFEAMPEGLQQSEQGQNKEQAAEALDEQVTNVESVMDELENVEF